MLQQIHPCRKSSRLAPGLDMVEKRTRPAAAANLNSLSSLLTVISEGKIFRIMGITRFVRDRIILKANTSLLERIQSTNSELAMTLLLIFKFQFQCTKAGKNT